VTRRVQSQSDPFRMCRSHARRCPSVRQRRPHRVQILRRFRSRRASLHHVRLPSLIRVQAGRFRWVVLRVAKMQSGSRESSRAKALQRPSVNTPRASACGASVWALSQTAQRPWRWVRVCAQPATRALRCPTRERALIYLNPSGEARAEARPLLYNSPRVIRRALRDTR